MDRATRIADEVESHLHLTETQLFLWFSGVMYLACEQENISVQLEHGKITLTAKGNRRMSAGEGDFISAVNEMYAFSDVLLDARNILQKRLNSA